MKAIYKNLALGTFLTVFAAAFAAPTFAQDVCKDVDANQALYKKYTDNYAGTIEQVKTAIAAAKEYIQKYEACKDDKGTELYAEQVNYFKGALPEREKFVADTEKANEAKAIYGKFDAAAQSKNVANILASGKELLAKYPNDLDVNIIMANAAFDEVIAKPTVTTYNNDVITYAKKSLELIEAGTKSDSEKFGARSYALGTKENALGVLNYSIGYTMLQDASRKKEATPYFYKATKYNSNIKDNPFIYQAIGANYLDEILALDKKRTDIIKAANGVDTPESLAVEAMQKGYTERALDAYARAYKSAKGGKTQKKEYMDSLSTRLKELYATRYTGKTLDNVDTFVTTTTSKTLVDPTTTVTPVVEEVAPTTPETTTPATTTTPKPGTGPTTTATPKPAATTPTKPVSSTTAPTTPETTTDADATAATKAKAKKPAPKKKGTR